MPRIVLTLALIIFSPIYSLPTSANPAQSSQITSDRDEYKYKYADGSGNLYIIGADSIDYRPMTREQSSSGMYDGGNPRKVKLDPRQYQAISVMLDRALSHPDNNRIDRTKGTGVILKPDKDRPIQRRVVSYNSQERQEIEALLDLLVGECKNMGSSIHRCGDKNK
jgi:hypothetical protein